MARAFFSIRADPLSYLGRAQRQYGDVVAFPIPGPPALLLNDPDDVRRVLQSAARSWGKQTVQYAALARVTGPGLLASSEPDWLTHRRIAAPAFHHQRLDRISHQVRAAADGSIADWVADQRIATAGATVDVAPLVLQVALDAVGRALFATDLSGSAHQLLDASSQAAALVVRLGRAVIPVPPRVPTPTNVRLRIARRRLDAISAQLVADRRGHDTAEQSGVPGDPAGHDDDTGHGDDLLGLLIDSGLSDQQVRNELVTMIIAGHETVATALAWTLMLLAQHQPAQDRLRAELVAQAQPVALLGHRTQLPWTRAVVDEALRLYPPAWAISRRAHAGDVIGGHPVPAGTIAIISPWLLHRDARRWPDPLAFRPERFLGQSAPRADYLPFGQGPRLCIGREFALGEMVIVLSQLLAGYRFELPPRWRPPQPEAQVAVHPHGGMPLRVTPCRGPTCRGPSS